MIDDLPLRRLSAAQHGLVTIGQMATAGYDKDARGRLVDGRRWERLADDVIRLVGSPATNAQLALASTLRAGPDGALSGSSAAAWWGIPGNTLEPIHVVRIRDRTTTTNNLGQNHEPVLLPAHHVVRLDEVPVVIPARALFDIAGTKRRGAEISWWIERMARMVDNAWSARLVSGRSLHEMLDELAQRGRPGIRVMRQVLAERGLDYVPPASNLEARFASILEAAGLPAMRRQVDTGDGVGWIGRVDFRADDLPFITEVQSERFHSSLIDRQLDEDRVARLERAGFVVAQVTDVQVWHRRHEVIRTVRDGRQLAALRVRPAS